MVLVSLGLGFVCPDVITSTQLSTDWPSAIFSSFFHPDYLKLSLLQLHHLQKRWAEPVLKGKGRETSRWEQDCWTGQRIHLWSICQSLHPIMLLTLHYRTLLVLCLCVCIYVCVYVYIYCICMKVEQWVMAEKQLREQSTQVYGRCDCSTTE